MRLKNKRYFILFIVIFVGAVGSGALLSAISWRLLRNEEIVFIEPGQFAGEDGTLADSRNLKPGDPVRETFTASVDGSALSCLRGELAVYIRQMKGEGYRVYWNGELIGSAGDIEEGKANIWNSSFLFPFVASRIEPVNTLTLEVLHFYESGLAGGAVALTDTQTARRLMTLNQMASAGLTLMGMGIVLAGCILITLMTFVNGGKRNRPFALMAAALVALLVYSADYLPLPGIFISYLAFKKIVLLCLFATVGLTGCALGDFFHKKYPAVVGSVSAALFIAAVAFCHDMITFKRVYDLMLLLAPANIFLWLWTVIPAMRTQEEAKLFFMAFLLGGVYVAYAVLTMICTMFLSNDTPFVVMMLYMCLVFLLHDTDLSRKNIQIARESQQRSLFYWQSITDSLTGIYKCAYVVKTAEEIQPPYAVAMIDVDRFKAINDQYGHPAGDRVLVHLAERLRCAIREKDLAGRYGGDEFIVLLRDCSGPGAMASMERLRESVQETPLTAEGQTISFTISIGLCHSEQKLPVKEMVAQADKALYKAKKTGRNRLCMVEMRGGEAFGEAREPF